MDIPKLVEQAFEAQKKAYAPYSHFHVGAALLVDSGDIVQGCNIESAAYSATNCAERTAIFSAISGGQQKFKAIAIVGGHLNKQADNYCYPCGVCRQVMMEFCNPTEFKIIVAKTIDDYQQYTLAELLPMGFGASHLK